MKQVERLPSLDGLRAVSISLVLLGHLNGTHGFPHIPFATAEYAHVGVLVFFVISGFLITRLLTGEFAKRGSVSLKLFYTRRALRLFPALYAYILIMAFLSLFGMIHLLPADLFGASTYIVNYMPHRSWQIGQLWSLSVEEQFYLLWPFAFALFRRRAPWIAGVVVLLGPVARSGAWLLLRHSPYYDVELFPTVADSLAMGCLLALMKEWLEQQRWYLNLFRPAPSIAMMLAILLITRYHGYALVSVPGDSLTYAMIAVLIHRSIYHPNDWTGRTLNWKPIAFVGVLSYSLYLWQQPFLDRHSTAWVNAFPQNIVFAVLAALCSYFALEIPFLKMRKRLRDEQRQVLSVAS